MEKITEKKAIKLLRKYSPNEKTFRIVLNHSKKVQEVALRLSKNINCDKDFIKTASLLHDIGRFKYFKKDTIKHGIEGERILRKNNLYKYAKVAERHIGAGISKKDIKEQKLPLPLKDYVPRTIEEKMIAHADNLVFGSREVPFKKVVDRFERELGKKTVKKFIKLKKSIEILNEN